jgi:hypothetical protein
MQSICLLVYATGGKKFRNVVFGAIIVHNDIKEPNF